ncbi:hypothetical protein [Sphingomonas parapaucimobilis]|uniref:hypothetical protein n=1 Tax=Sphingomonas parapaucimobilis TaxID=28213 RepID=UPI0035C7A8A9
MTDQHHLISDSTKLEVTRTARGFAVARGVDRYAAPYSIQDSSLAEEAAIWLGSDADTGGRAHLTQDMAASLVPLLQAFVATGSIAGSADTIAAPPAVDREAVDFLHQLRRVNTERYEAWVEGADAGIMFDALELGGEVGELLNVVKKLEREERGWRGSRVDPADFADECADVLICLDKLARRRGVDLIAATIAKFNATSDKVGLPHKLSTLCANAIRQGEGDIERAAKVADHYAEEAETHADMTDLGARVEMNWHVRAEALRAVATRIRALATPASHASGAAATTKES